MESQRKKPVIAHNDIYKIVIHYFVVPFGAFSLFVLGSMQIYMIWKNKNLSSLVFWEAASRIEYIIIKISFFCFIAMVFFGVVLSFLSN